MESKARSQCKLATSNVSFRLVNPNLSYRGETVFLFSNSDLDLDLTRSIYKPKLCLHASLLYPVSLKLVNPNRSYLAETFFPIQSDLDLDLTRSKCNPKLGLYGCVLYMKFRYDWSILTKVIKRTCHIPLFDVAWSIMIYLLEK